MAEGPPVSMGKKYTIGGHQYRQRALRRDAKVRRKQLDAAWRMHQAGYSIAWIARQTWERFGYTSPDSCRRSLTKLFALELRFARKQDPFYVEGACAGCGVDRDERTRGCGTCTARHHYRMKVAA